MYNILLISLGYKKNRIKEVLGNLKIVVFLVSYSFQDNPWTQLVLVFFMLDIFNL